MDKLIHNIPGNWQRTIIHIIIVIFLSVTMFFDSWYTIVEIWYRSSTFTHGFLIIPISLWLIWTQRKLFSTLTPEINWKIIVTVFMSGFLWLLADLSHVQVIKQFATVSILISSLCLVLGWEYYSSKYMTQHDS